MVVSPYYETKIDVRQCTLLRYSLFTHCQNLKNNCWNYPIDRSLNYIFFQADLLLSYGYEGDIKALTPHIPKRCQCLLMSATSRFVIYIICAPFLLSAD